MIMFRARYRPCTTGDDTGLTPRCSNTSAHISPEVHGHSRCTRRIVVTGKAQ